MKKISQLSPKNTQKESFSLKLQKPTFCFQDVNCRRHTTMINIESDGRISHTNILSVIEEGQIATTSNKPSVAKHFWSCKNNVIINDGKSPLK